MIQMTNIDKSEKSDNRDNSDNIDNGDNRDNSRDFKIHYGEALVRRMQPKETGPTTASPAKTRID